MHSINLIATSKHHEQKSKTLSSMLKTIQPDTPIVQNTQKWPITAPALGLILHCTHGSVHMQLCHEVSLRRPLKVHHLYLNGSLLNDVTFYELLLPMHLSIGMSIFSDAHQKDICCSVIVS